MSDETHVPPENLVSKSGIFKGMNAFMAIASMIMILAFVAFTVQDVEYSGAVFAQGKDFIIGALDWFYVLVVTLALFFVFWLLVSRFGDVKLGKEDDEPDFSTFSWICMLFSAGRSTGHRGNRAGAKVGDRVGVHQGVDLGLLGAEDSSSN